MQELCLIYQVLIEKVFRKSYTQKTLMLFKCGATKFHYIISEYRLWDQFICDR